MRYKYLNLIAFCVALNPAQAQEVLDADALLSRFLADHAQDFDRCFEDLDELVGIGSAAEFEAAAGVALPVPRRLVIAVDSSGSMAGWLGSGPKMTAAKDAVLGFLDTVPGDVEVSLVGFGHRGTNDEAGKTESCRAVEMLAPMRTDRAPVIDALSTLQPTGWTPLASALEVANAAFGPGDLPGEQVIYVVSDGQETCGGDPVAVAQALHLGRTKAVINILGFDLTPEDRAQLEAVADAGGGVFTEVDDEDELRQWMDELRRTNANYAAILNKRNEAFTARLDNSNEVFSMLLNTSNCIGTGQMTEKNALYDYMSEHNVPQDVADAAIALIEERHRAYDEKFAVIEAAAEAALKTANDALQRDLDRAEEGFEKAE